MNSESTRGTIERKKGVATRTRSAARFAFCLFTLVVAFLFVVACGDADDGLSGPNAGKAQPIETLALGQEHTCAVVDAGTVYCWGAGGAGQLGNGDRQDLRLAGEVVALTGVDRVFAGTLTTCALTEAGEAWCWGQVVAHSTESHAEPRRLAVLDGVVDLDIGQTIACAAHQDGGVSCWGQVSLHTEAEEDPVADPLTVSALQNAEGIATGGAYVCTRRTDAQVECIGLHPALDLEAGDELDTPHIVAGVEGVTAIDAGYQHMCALLADDTVTCWGENFRGELGRGTTTDTPGTRLAPAPVAGLDEVVSLATGHAFSCAVREDGTVWCWGDSGNYTLGEAVMDGSPAPEPVQVAGVGDAVGVKAGHSFACALKADATVVCWGFGTDTDGGIRPSATPLPYPW